MSGDAAGVSFVQRKPQRVPKFSPGLNSPDPIPVEFPDCPWMSSIPTSALRKMVTWLSPLSLMFPDLSRRKNSVVPAAPPHTRINVEAEALAVSVTFTSMPRHVVPLLFHVCWCVNAAVAKVPALTVSAPVMVPPALSSLAASADERAALETPALEKALNGWFIINLQCKKRPQWDQRQRQRFRFPQHSPQPRYQRSPRQAAKCCSPKSFPLLCESTEPRPCRFGWKHFWLAAMLAPSMLKLQKQSEVGRPCCVS